MALNIPLSELGDDQQIVGVYATTSRRKVTMLSRRPEKQNDTIEGQFIQVARQGNPLFNEGLVAIADKDLYSRTKPTRDPELFRQYAENPELCRLLNALVIPITTLVPCIETAHRYCRDLHPRLDQSRPVDPWCTVCGWRAKPYHQP